MFKRKIYAIFAVIGLIAGSVGVFSENTDGFAVNTTERFSDVSADMWYYPYVIYLAENKIVNGMTPTEFVPGGTFTVAESAAVITRYLGLEDEAAKRKSAMEILGVKGSDKWYSGYIQLMHEAGIIDVQKYGCTLNGSSVSIDIPEMLESAVKRYEFAAFITRSFELDGTGITTSQGTNGNEFIYNGSYDEGVLELFIPLINDYEDIPEGYGNYVLKAYYNGIFNGDNLGNFNPNSNLTRAEMAKVITVIIDASQRVRLETENKNPDKPSGYVLGDDSFTVYKNVKYLKNEVSDSVLLGEVVSGLSLNGDKVSFKPSLYYPEGYTVNLRHYRKTLSGFMSELNVEYEDNTYTADFIPEDILLFVLSENTTGKAVDAYEIRALTGGMTANSYCNYLP